MRKLIVLLVAGIMLSLSPSSAAADPTWPPRPLRQTYTYCVQGRNVQGCITLPRPIGRLADKLTGTRRACHVGPAYRCVP